MYTTDYEVKLMSKKKTLKKEAKEALQTPIDISFDEKIKEINSLAQDVKNRCIELYHNFPKKDLSDMIIDINSFCDKNYEILN